MNKTKEILTTEKNILYWGYQDNFLKYINKKFNGKKAFNSKLNFYYLINPEFKLIDLKNKFGKKEIINKINLLNKNNVIHLFKRTKKLDVEGNLKIIWVKRIYRLDKDIMILLDDWWKENDKKTK